MEQHIDCKICTESLVGQEIRSCTACNNLVCSKCAAGVNSCPYCREYNTLGQRNIAVERMLSNSHSYCINKRYGCSACIDKDTKEKHEETCEYFPFECPFKLQDQNLCWSGDYKGLKEHINITHEITTLKEVYYTRPKVTFFPQSDADETQERIFCLLVNSNENIIFCRIKMSENNLVIGVSRVRKSNETDKYYGIGLEIGTILRTEKRNIMIEKYYDEITFTSQFLLSADNDLLKHEISVSLDVMSLSSLLTDGVNNYVYK